METMMVDELVNCFRRTLNNSDEIFLHLLLSNSALALDRRESKSSTVPPLRYINVVPDKKYKTLTITDNGVGMTHAELLNLVTISSSTAKEAVEAVAHLNRPGLTHADLLKFGTMGLSSANFSIKKAVSDLNCIWPSGFGFYFAFLVADKVQLRTKHYNDNEYVLDFDLQGRGSPTITSGTLGLYRSSGSMMTLFLKEDQLQYLEVPRLRDLISRCSSLIGHEINLVAEHQFSKVKNPASPYQHKKMIRITTHTLETFNGVTS